MKNPSRSARPLALIRCHSEIDPAIGKTVSLWIADKPLTGPVTGYKGALLLPFKHGDVRLSWPLSPSLRCRTGLKRRPVNGLLEFLIGLKNLLEGKRELRWAIHVEVGKPFFRLVDTRSVTYWNPP